MRCIVRKYMQQHQASSRNNCTQNYVYTGNVSIHTNAVRVKVATTYAVHGCVSETFKAFAANGIVGKDGREYTPLKQSKATFL